MGHRLWGFQAAAVGVRGLNCPVWQRSLPRPGPEPASSALAGRLLITGPPEKSNSSLI